MISRKCPHCGKRNFTGNPRCSNCNEILLPAETTSVKDSPQPKSPPPIKPKSESEVSTPSSSPSSPENTQSSSSPNPPSSTPAPTPIPTPAPPSAPVPIPTPVSPSAPTSTSFPNPYSKPPTPFGPYYTPLPPSLAKMPPPDVEGEVILEKTIQIDRKEASGWLRTLVGIILLPFRPAIVLLAWVFSGNRPKNKKDVFIIRVEDISGNIVETRYEDELKGATFTTGDYVSLWGVENKGILYIKQGFNHTNRGQL